MILIIFVVEFVIFFAVGRDEITFQNSVANFEGTQRTSSAKISLLIMLRKDIRFWPVPASL